MLIFTVVFFLASGINADDGKQDGMFCSENEICGRLLRARRAVYTGYVKETKCNCISRRGGNSKLLLCLRITLPVSNQTKSQVEAAINNCLKTLPGEVKTTQEDTLQGSCDKVVDVVNDKSYEHHNLYSLNMSDPNWSFCHGLWARCSGEAESTLTSQGCTYVLETLTTYKNGDENTSSSENVRFLNLTQTMLHNGERYLVNGDQLCGDLKPLHLLSTVPKVILNVLKRPRMCNGIVQSHGQTHETEKDENKKTITFSALTDKSGGLLLSPQSFLILSLLITIRALLMADI